MSTDGFSRCAGKLAAFTSIGSYPIFYLTRQHYVICAECAEEALNNPEAFDPPVSSDVFWEGEPITCDACSDTIESAYGDPDEAQRVEIQEADHG